VTFRVVLLWLATVTAVAAAESDFTVASNIIDPDKEGQELAARLRSAKPDGSADFQGVLGLTARNGTVRKIPLRSHVNLTSTNWQATYEALQPDGSVGSRLAIVHAAGRTNVYWVSSATNATPSGPADLASPFAGSDFSLQDLGLEFYHWPRQRALRSEMSRGRACRVLESVQPNPLPGGYGRVVSWIDLETGGLLQAEAYLPGNPKPLKKFSLGSFEKLNGHWHLRDMRIRNLRTGTQTELKFDLRKKAE
jgi:hypothetical protein